MRASGFERPSLWLISEHKNGRMEVLTIETGGEETLPLFTLEEEAETFLRLQAPAREGLRARETTRGELASLLYGRCAGVRRVLLDPLPSQVGGETMTKLVSLGWEEFVRDFLMVERTKEIAIPDSVAWDFAESGRRGAR